MTLNNALKQYEKCEECAYVDDCPNREDKIAAAFAEEKIDVKCKNEKENDVYENH